MALLVFPPPTFNGQLYPVAPVVGQYQYVWSTADNTWRIVGVATGVIPGVYGDAVTIPQFTVNAVGTITAVTNVPIQTASLTQPGIVQLVGDTVTNDPTKALTASAGYDLQLQIDDLGRRANMTFAGTINASNGQLVQLTPEGLFAGFVVGGLLPAASTLNDEYFVVVVDPGTFTPPGGVAQTFKDGDWIFSDGTQWVRYPVGPDPQTLVFIDDISGTFNGSLLSFPLTVGGSPVSPTTNLLVFVGGVPQLSGVSYSVTGSTITFNEAPLTGTTFIAVTVM